MVVALAAATVSSADSVSVTLSRRGQFVTAAASDETANRLDNDQYAVGQGPCVHTATTGEQAHLASTREESRWPDFVPRALDAGVTTILSSPLTLNTEPVGALNIYSHGDEPFGVDQQDLAQLIAGQAAGILADDNDDLTAAERARRLREALRTREVIAQAQGILIQRDRISAEGAAD